LQAEKNAVQTQLHAAQKGFELGSTTIADTYEAQARLDLLNASELQAQNVLQVSQDLLAKIINERPAQLVELAPDTVLPGPVPNRLADWTTQSSNANLAVAQADLAAKIVEKQIDIAKSQNYPTLSLQAQTGSASNNNSGIGNTASGPRSLDSNVGLQLSIPIFTGGEISSVVREQTSRLQQARYQLEDAKRQAVQTTQQYYSGVTSGLAQVAALQAAEKSSLASLQANQTGYEIGVRINIDVLNAQQQLYETQRNLARARYDTLMNSLKLKASSGILSDQDIIAINQLLTRKG
jgi:outer membrane protein